MFALVLSCEKEQKEELAVQEGAAELISVERIDLNQPDRPGEDLGGDREHIPEGMSDCHLSGDPEDKLNGEKCVSTNYDECKPNTNERCKAKSTGVGAIAQIYLTPSEINMFWSKTYNEQFVLDNWDFFMACYNAGKMYHPNEIITRNFR